MVEEVYDLSKTNWIEIDLPVTVEGSLMEFFDDVRGILPLMHFYMGFRDVDMCLGSDEVITYMNMQ